MEDSKPVSRRCHAAELKRQVLAACAQPGASVAQVALTRDLNANLVHKWQRTLNAGCADAKHHGTRQTEFVPVALAAGPTEVSHIQLELRCGALAVNVAWPLSASSQCAAWLREILR